MRTLVASLVCFLITHLVLRAQEIDATVSVSYDRLSLNGQSEVSGFADELKRYVESIRWTNDEWEGEKIRMNFNVVFTGESGSGDYGATLVVGSQRAIGGSDKQSPMMKILDNAWSFQYVRNQPFIQDPTRYNDLTGLLDFYVYIAIGLDFDSYSPKGGAAMYEQARLISQRAQIVNNVAGWTADAAPGAYTRMNFIKELTNLRYEPLRLFIYNYHYNGLDLLAKNRTRALDSLNAFISDLVQAVDRLVEPSTIIRVLNDTKNLEYAELFRDYRDPDGLIWRKLIYLDPSHKQIYDAAR